MTPPTPDRAFATWKLENTRRFREASAPILAELAQIGFPVESVEEIRRAALSKREYRAILPILLNWLPRVEDPYLKTAMLHALATRWAAPTALHALFNEYRNATSESIRSIAGDAIRVLASEAVGSEVIELALDRRYGAARRPLVEALGKMKGQSAFQALIFLLDDDVVTTYAMIALSRLRDPRAQPHIERFLDHPEPLVRKEAQKSLDKIARAEQKAREKRN